MLKINVNDKEYKIRYGYNSFCDSDLMERTNDVMKLFNDVEEADEHKEDDSFARFKDLFSCVRELLFVGLQRYHKDEFTTHEAVGDFLDDYNEETEKGILDVFGMIIEELFAQGFLKGMMEDGETPTTPKVPQDHKQKKRSTKKLEVVE